MFDEKLWQDVARRLAVSDQVDLNQEDPVVQQIQLRQVRQAKEMLSRRTECKLRLTSSQGTCSPVMLTRRDFETLISEDIDKASRLVQRLLNGIGEQSQKPELLLLVGGTSQIPAIENRLKQTSGLTCRKWQWSREAVSLGTALLAHEDGNQLAMADVKARDAEGKTALMKAAELGKAQVINKLVERGADMNARDKYGFTSLMIAASKGEVESIEALVRSGADVNARNNDGSTSLMIAASEGEVESIEALVRSGADVNAWKNDGSTALMIAASKGQVESIEALVRSGADVSARNDFGSTALMSAAWNGDVESIEALVRSGADVNARKNDGSTALMSAAWNGDVESIEALVRSGADVNARKISGFTSLMIAASKGQVESIEALIRCGADVNVMDNYGRTALTLARDIGYTDIVSLLKRNGARDRKGCFITTVVCEHTGKPDDCAELTELRRFRDSWLARQDGGKELIDEYYRIAPIIVKCLDRLENPGEVYRELLERYIEPCVALIGEGRHEECLELYKSMVETLRCRYLDCRR